MGTPVAALLLLSMLLFNRVEPQFRWLDAGECENVFSDDDVRLAQERIREGHVDAEALAVDLARQPALSAIAEAVVPPALEVHIGLLRVCLNLEDHEVAEVYSSGLLKAGQRILRRADDAQVHVPCGPGSFEAELEHQASLEHCRLAENPRDARKEPIEHEQLPAARQLGT